MPVSSCAELTGQIKTVLDELGGDNMNRELDDFNHGKVIEQIENKNQNYSG